MPIIAVKGTHDIIGDEASAYAYIQNVFRAVAELYAYKPIETPILEYTETFTRSTGESSDVVRKEMYTFLDKGDRSVTLRPEHTAGVARSIVEKKLLSTSDMPLKLYYSGPTFRYERPQLGRYRQFIQAGCECVGLDSAWVDAECVSLACRTLDYLGFKGIKVKVNTLGDKESRAAYRQALKEYFAPSLDQMCEDCKKRYELNPLRILDCKVKEDQELVKGAPKMKDFLSEAAERRFYDTLSILADEGIDYEIDETLVRGLDYYGHIVFEIHAISNTGADYGALLGGGHYDGMLASMGERSDADSGVGFAFGVERVYSVMKDNGMLGEILENGVDCYLMPLEPDYIQHAYTLAQSLRSLGYSVDMPYAKTKVGTMFKKANRKKAKVAILFGETELLKGAVQVKVLASEEQFEVSLDNLPSALDELFREEGGDDEHCCCDGDECQCGHHHDEEGHHCCHHHHDEGDGENQ